MKINPRLSRLETIAGYRKAIEQGIRKDCEAEVRRELAKGDLFFLLTVVLGRADINHDWLFDRCREVQKNPDGYLDLWSREHYKSTIVTYGMTIQNILNDPEITVGIFSFNRPTAKQFLRQIKREFESNDNLKSLFPEIVWSNATKEAPKWSEDDGIIVKRKSNPKESTVEAWGLTDGQPTSKHFKLMVYDDIVTRDTITEGMLPKTLDAWRTSRALRTEGGKTRYVGTRWSHNDTYRTIIEQGSAIPRIHLVTTDGTVTGEPVLRSREWVAEQYRDMGKYVFGAQMLQDPTADKSQGFREEWIRHYETRDGDFSRMNKYILCDPASQKKKNSDYTTFAVIGLADDDNYYLLDMVRDRLSLTQRGDAMFALHRRWKPKGVGYERYGMMSDIEYIEDRQKTQNYRFEITEVGGQVAKHDRIGRLVPLFEAGRFWLPEVLMKVDADGKHVDLVQSFLDDEYRTFPVGVHDDMLDAISRIWDIDVIWPKSVVEKTDRYARARVRSRRRGSFMAA